MSRDALEALVLAAREPGQPGASFRLFDALVQERVGRIFTTMLLVRPDGLGERVFTTDPVAYPMPHRKPFPGSGWTEQVIEGAQPSLSRNMAEYLKVHVGRVVFEALGAGCLLNMPAVYGGSVVGVVNISAVANAYDEATIAMLAPLVAALAPAFALLRRELGEAPSAAGLPAARRS
ncbi:MAG: hypothetical protein IT557_18255 [Alphaproteobacteria bacterium]|nr:hypothetical protein [Alphaproteobacteria bacterium]